MPLSARGVRRIVFFSAVCAIAACHTFMLDDDGTTTAPADASTTTTVPDGGEATSADAVATSAVDAGGSDSAPPPTDAAVAVVPVSVPPRDASCSFPVPSYTGPTPPNNCPCTRRPSPYQEQMCPIGNCSSITVHVGADGGVVELPNSHEESACGVKPRIVIPAGALDHDVAITLTELNYPPPKDYQDHSPIYRFEPLDLQLYLAATFVVGSSNTHESIPYPRAYWSTTDLTSWEPVHDSVYAGGYVQGSTTRLGYVFAGYTRAEENVPAACP